MPTLKIGCRVYHRNHGEAVLVSYDDTSSMPWTLVANKATFSADHKDFSDTHPDCLRNFSDKFMTLNKNKLRLFSVENTVKKIYGAFSNAFLVKIQ